jgi:hypothetical protein
MLGEIQLGEKRLETTIDGKGRARAVARRLIGRSVNAWAKKSRRSRDGGVVVRVPLEHDERKEEKGVDDAQGQDGSELSGGANCQREEERRAAAQLGCSWAEMRAGGLTEQDEGDLLLPFFSFIFQTIFNRI